MTNKNNTIKIDLCCGIRKPDGYIGVDNFKNEKVDIISDLNERFPFDDNSVDYVRAHDAIEHLKDKIQTMNEIWRVCKPAATVDIFVPSTDGRGAFQDPTHISYWNINSFMYYSVDNQPALELCHKYGFKGAFKITQIYNIDGGNGIIHVQAFLTAIK
ncbi:MAG: hypothetical protein DKM50_11055 [Candidatus Margulisiibacteriota bacterium]|nr:MAG: hypothetical protein A2X43_07865 [Candidatus Margulisbacteria bacterium GWD2_39_127]OGI04689.1 MAG: hypothetical protein A2X42_11065 [Candidatus Margulisbacteria bacterium GWF2_38_17]PZM78665.1 MAG: hypothetical protein DKM50_11055 [Candidatus Margulisiibacteriota bacterium]HAR62007.1 hypothetical protein [Candidatus Margulisiibacteriota bacterium]HCT86281.1 hypothetical protein [Candidatus Margulisiibacteriota bacterium]